jgi:hypothetical protein
MCLMSSQVLQLVFTPQLAKLFCKTGCSARQILVKERNSCLYLEDCTPCNGPLC